jgi:hypothetical protein
LGYPNFIGLGVNGEIPPLPAPLPCLFSSQIGFFSLFNIIKLLITPCKKRIYLENKVTESHSTPIKKKKGKEKVKDDDDDEEYKPENEEELEPESDSDSSTEEQHEHDSDFEIASGSRKRKVFYLVFTFFNQNVPFLYKMLFFIGSIFYFKMFFFSSNQFVLSRYILVLVFG